MGREYSNTIIAGSRVMAADIAQIRSFIDQDLAAIGQSFPWTWTNVASGDRVLAKHFKEMCDAAQQLWNAKNRGPLPMWSSGVSPGGESLGTTPTRVFASDLTDLRIWLNQYEDNHPPALQGLNTLSYHVEADKIISSTGWADDVVALRFQDPRLLAKANIRVAPGQCFLTPEQKARYSSGFLRFRDAGLPRRFALLGWEFMPGPECGMDPLDPLDPSDWANPYIREFASRAHDFSQFLVAAGAAEDFIIWNEPNNLEPILPASHFAALLWRCWNVMTAAPRVYMGGTYLPQNNPDAGLDYLSAVYEALYGNGKAGGSFGAWPWDGINIHMHNNWTDTSIARTFGQQGDLNPHANAVYKLKSRWGDPTEVLVGEWGLSSEAETANPGAIQHMHDALGNTRASAMFFWTHHRVDEPPNTWGLHEWDPYGPDPELVVGAERTTVHVAYDQAVGP